MASDYQQVQADNPRLATPVRVFFVIVALVVLVGSGLFFFPDLIGPRWPWRLAPFNSRFLGSIYISELAILAVLIPVNRWAPIRLFLPMGVVFAGVVSVVTLFHLDRFDPQRWATYTWFVLYIGATAVTGYFLWMYRRLPPANIVPLAIPLK